VSTVTLIKLSIENCEYALDAVDSCWTCLLLMTGGQTLGFIELANNSDSDSKEMGDYLGELYDVFLVRVCFSRIDKLFPSGHRKMNLKAHETDWDLILDKNQAFAGSFNVAN